MANENEAIADIIAEMRRREKSHYYPKVARNVMHQYANRIEAAWKRQEQCYLDQIRDAVNMIGHERFVKEHPPVGNAAAMREALRYIVNQIDKNPDRLSAGQLLCIIGDKAEAALSTPDRNCDRFKTGKEAKYRFLQIAELPEGNRDADMREWYRKLIAWLFAPAQEQKGATA